MSKRRNRNRTKAVTTTAITPGLPDRLQTPEHLRALEATRSFYSNAVAWGTNLLTDARDEYSIDDVTAARLYAISVTAWACANYRAQAEAAIVPQVVYSGTDQPVEAADNPVRWFVENAEPLLLSVSTSLLIWGKFFVFKQRNHAGLPTRLKWLSPLDVSPVIDHEHQVFSGYRVRGYDQMIAPRDMIVNLTFDPLNDYDGVSPYEVSMRQVIGARELIRFGQKYFQDGTMLGGMLSYEGDLGDEEFKRVQADFQQFKGSQNAFKTFIAGGGLAKFSYTPFQPAPVDLAMGELKAMLDGDTCRAFGVNPILIGIGDAKDPLSAQNTYQQIEDKFVHNTVVPRVRWIYSALNEQWLQSEFSAWGDLKLTPDLSEINAESKATPERTTTASTNVQRFWSVNESREYTGLTPLPFGIQLNPEWATMVYNAGGIRLNEYRRHIGLPPADQDGYIYEVDPRQKGQTSQLSFNMPPSLPHEIPLEDQKKKIPLDSPIPVGEIRSDDGGIYCLLSLANDPTITAIQADLIAGMSGVEWVDPGDFHVTLVYSPGCDDRALVEAIVPKSISPLGFEIVALDTFPADQVQPLYLTVQPGRNLTGVQAGLAATFDAVGLPLSEYSFPATWQPHITLGYMPVGTEIPPLSGTAELSSAVIVCSIERDGRFQNWYITRSAGQVKAEAAGQVAELEMWSKKVKRFGPDAAFEPAALSSTIADYVRAELAGKWNPQAVFAEAKNAIRQSRPPEPLGATPEAAAEYWRDFDAITQGIGQAWEQYNADIGAKIFDDLIEQRTAVNLDQVFADHHQALVDQWVGTVDDPGDILKLILAGMKAGQVSLEKEVAANPNKPRAGTSAKPSTFQLQMDWNLASSQARDFAYNYAFSLIRDIDQTTRNRISQAVQDYISGAPHLQKLDDLRAVMAKIITPPGQAVSADIKVRAAAIADTESMRAYNSGALNRWQAVGVTQATFNTVRDEHVCPICRPLFGVKADVRVGWQVGASNKVPPLHVRCRCFMRPDVSSAAGSMFQDTTELEAAKPKPKPVALQPKPIAPPTKVDPRQYDYRGVIQLHRAEVDEIVQRLQGKVSGTGAELIGWKQQDAEYTKQIDALENESDQAWQDFLNVGQKTKAVKMVKVFGGQVPDKIDWESPEYKAYKKRYDALQQQIADLRDARYKIRQQIEGNNRLIQEQALTYGITTQTPIPKNPLAVGKSFGSGDRKQRFDEAREFLSKRFNGDVYGDKTIRPVGAHAFSGRAFFDNYGTINTDPNDPTWVYVHEIGHHIEWSDPEIHNRCVEFLRKRAAESNETVPTWLGSGYGKDELAIKDKFRTPYIGKIYNADSYLNGVTPTLANDPYATEVLSVGLEYMMKDPAAFATEDPDHFELTLGIMRGWYHQSGDVAAPNIAAPKILNPLPEFKTAPEAELWAKQRNAPVIESNGADYERLLLNQFKAHGMSDAGAKLHFAHIGGPDFVSRVNKVTDADRLIVQTAINQNYSNPLFSRLAQKFGAQPVVALQAAKKDVPPGNINSDFGDNIAVHIGPGLPPLDEKTPTPKDKNAVQSGGLAGGLRREYAEHVWNKLTPAQKADWESMTVNKPKVGPNVNANVYQTAYPKETFKETFAVATSPALDESQFSPATQQLFDWINKL